MRRKIDGQIDRQIDKKIGRQKDRQIDREGEREIDRQRVSKIDRYRQIEQVNKESEIPLDLAKICADKGVLAITKWQMRQRLPAQLL